VSTSTTDGGAIALLEALLDRLRLGVRERRAEEDGLRWREADFLPELRRWLRLEELLRLLLSGFFEDGVRREYRHRLE